MIRGKRKITLGITRRFATLLFLTLGVALMSEGTMAADPENTLYLELKTGRVVIELRPDLAPNHVARIKELVRQGFYDGLKFHRVIPGFMVQTGDPKGNGSGGPGYRFADEPVSRSYSKGIVAMANAGPNTNGSQFFIIHAAQYPLDPDYTIFGQVTQGLETVDEIANSPVQDIDGRKGSSPIEPIIVESVEITER